MCGSPLCPCGLAPYHRLWLGVAGTRPIAKLQMGLCFPPVQRNKFRLG